MERFGAGGDGPERGREPGCTPEPPTGAARPEERGEPGEDWPQGAPLSERACVLVVEDEPAVACALGELLGRRFEVRLVSDGEQALALARETLPDLILLDRLLPRLEGLAVLEALQLDPRTEDIPVIVHSADRDEAAVVRSLELGAADYVAKPVGPRELVARMERALRQARQRRLLQAMAQTDALTGLANFRSLAVRLEEEFKRANRYRHPLAAVMLDLDYLKELNDRWGHDVGNQAILALARHLRANLREVDFAARFGGDEFVVLLPHQTASEAAVFAERVRSGLCQVRVRPELEDAPELRLTISIGVADHSEASPRASAEALLKAADAALYRAKVAGRDRLAFQVAEVAEEARTEARH